MIKTVDYDRLATSAPMNVQAAAMRDGRGEHFGPRLDPAVTFEGPPKMRSVPDAIEDLTGFRHGRLTVVGQARVAHGYWVVRCLCGNYEFRSGAQLKISALDRCAPCQYWRDVRLESLERAATSFVGCELSFESPTKRNRVDRWAREDDIDLAALISCGCTYSEVALELGRTRNAVSQRASRLRARGWDL